LGSFQDLLEKQDTGERSAGVRPELAEEVTVSAAAVMAQLRLSLTEAKVVADEPRFHAIGAQISRELEQVTRAVQRVVEPTQQTKRR
jgi:hypothetical protein